MALSPEHWQVIAGCVALANYLHVCQGVRYPRPPAIFSGSLAIVLIHISLSLCACETCEAHVPRTPCGCFQPQIDMLHSPSGFPFRISRGIIGFGFLPLDTFTYPLLKGESTQPHEWYIIPFLWAHSTFISLA